ncbi:MAG TPA: (d)CMP kinase [Myxococcales bacterium]|nr:(d)CMP kinase [Myxococcales bacterium]
MSRCVSAPIVAIDGPAGAGKSTVARQLARRLGFSMIDTGAIYRSVALEALRRGIAWDDDEALRQMLVEGLGLEFRGDRVLLHGGDVSEAIRTPEISRGASVVSARPVVRKELLQLQRNLGRAATRGAVLEGRDIGTVVFPDAEVKFFLTASDEARAGRRHAELLERGLSVPLSEVLADQRRRDRDDSERAIAPLRPADDAIRVETTGLDLNEVVERCFREAFARLTHLKSGQS